jgi:type VI secretion system secreted protein Hcp
MALDLFLRIEGLAGESTDDAHTRWIELLSFDQQLALDRSVAEAAAPLTPSHLCRLEKFADVSSPKLALACCSGQHFEQAVIEVCKAGGDKNRLVWWTLDDVRITSIRCFGHSMGEALLPMEELMIVCRRIEWSYSVVGHTGKAQGNVVSYWDFDSNTGG